MVKVAVVGLYNDIGIELIKLLLRHPEVNITFISGKPEFCGNELANIYPVFTNLTDLNLLFASTEEVIESDSDCVFCLMPGEISLKLIPEVIRKSNKRIIDFSRTFRLEDNKLYTSYSSCDDIDVLSTQPACYGFPELYKPQIRKSKIVLLPDICSTAIVLSLRPLLTSGFLKTTKEIIIDSKIPLREQYLTAGERGYYLDGNEFAKTCDFSIQFQEQELLRKFCNISEFEFKMIFVPHYIPLNRGIMTTIYLPMKDKIDVDKVLSLLKEAYKNKEYVRVFPKGIYPEIKHVLYTPYCDIGCYVRDNILIVTSCLDNFMKGSASQAIQVFNFMYGFKEPIGLNV